MRKIVLPVQIEPLEEGGFLASSESIQGCHAEGETVAEALENLEDVARILLEILREDGVPFPLGLEEFTPGAVFKAQVVVPLPE